MLNLKFGRVSNYLVNKPLITGRFFLCPYCTIKSMYMMNTLNPNCFTYTTDELLIELLGGVRTDTLDRMRVTMKVNITNRKHPQYTSETANLSVRHNLDLYNDNQVEKFVRRVAERLEVGSIAITKAIADITGQLEVWRLEQLDKVQEKPVKPLTAEEREVAIQFLQAPIPRKCLPARGTLRFGAQNKVFTELL